MQKEDHRIPSLPRLCSQRDFDANQILQNFIRL